MNLAFLGVLQGKSGSALCALFLPSPGVPSHLFRLTAASEGPCPKPRVWAGEDVGQRFLGPEAHC